MLIIKQDTNGSKPLLEIGELGYDNYPIGGGVVSSVSIDGSANTCIITKELVL